MANDARMYIGNVFVDELDSVQFVLQDNKIPMYPYMGRYFAAIGQGRSLVRGQIAINFISEGYLYAVLDNYETSPISSNPQQEELNQMVAAQSNPGQTGLDTAKSYSKKVQLGSLATTAQFPNAVYQGGPFDIEVDFTAGGRTVIRRLESCFPGIPLRPKPKTSRAGASRRPRVEGRAERLGLSGDGKRAGG